MKTILIVDDEPAVLGIFRFVLKDYKLIEVESSEEALQIFVEQSGQIDLLLADVSLPRISGVQLAVALRGTNPGLPVILMSGYPENVWNDQDSWNLKRLRRSSVTVLQKPFSPARLKAVVQAILTEEPAGRRRAT